MSWIRLDDQFTEHPKLLRAGPAAGWLFVCGLTYASRYLTDGFLPSPTIRSLCVELKRTEALAERLVDCGLWEPAEGGYQIHDYLKYNPSAEKVRAEREGSARRVAAHRDRKNGQFLPLEKEPVMPVSRVSNAVTSPHHSVTSGVGNGVGNGDVTPAPYPGPGPGPGPAPGALRPATSRVNTTGDVPPVVKTRAARADAPAAEPSTAGVNFGPLADAFHNLGVPFPRPIGTEVKAAQTLLQHYSPSDLAECWQDALNGDFFDDYDRRKLSYAYLTRENRVGNWQRWRDEGKPRQEKPHANARIHRTGGDPPPDPSALDELDRDWDQVQRDRITAAART